MAIPVNPQAQALLDGRAAAGSPPTWKQTPAQVRAGFAATRELIGPGPAVASARDIAIPGQAGGIPARVYTPRDASAGIVVYFHGGGWVIGSVDDWDAVCRVLAVASGCRLVSVDYRLAPEHRFPAAVDDAYDALTWVAGASQLTGAGPLVVAGDSAGGNLAAVCALRARDAGGPELVLQVLVYPVADHDLDRHSYHVYNGNDFLVNRRDMAWFWDQYVPDPAARANPYASPLRAASLSGLPPAYIVTAEHDPLRDEGFAYADRLRAARVPVQHRHYGSEIHGFFSYVNVLDDADKAVADAGAVIRDAATGAVQGSDRVTQEA
ncbi:MAG TPA: alpha/beta hydrolase [Trebonia sp.]